MRPGFVCSGVIVKNVAVGSAVDEMLTGQLLIRIAVKDIPVVETAEIKVGVSSPWRLLGTRCRGFILSSGHGDEQ